ncbi:MAG: ORF6N domain-containing protein [Pyrinomonadaceae bacterium]
MTKIMANEENQETNLIVFEKIENRIYNIRGERVMLDSDLAEIYGVETRILKQAVRRNLHRFPTDFMFELTLEELRDLESLRSQVVTLDNKKSKRGKYGKYAPFVFTEHGAVMLASVLKSPTAIEASLQIVRAFVRLRTILTEHKELAERIEKLEKQFVVHNKNFKVVFDMLRPILVIERREKRQIGFVEKDKKK